MSSNRTIFFTRLIHLSGADEILIMLILSCLLPFIFHALPLSAAPGFGQRWLPIFYAPLIAAICFQPHVTLISACVSPWLNHIIFGVPDERMFLFLTFELIVFNMILVVLNRYRRIRGWHIIPAYVVTILITLLVFSRPLVQLTSLISVAAPGLLLMVILGELAGRFKSGDEV